ncbi:MAG: hypothetical protein ACRDZN_13820, partial [Acidimicrobiales bacterium]
MPRVALAALALVLLVAWPTAAAAQEPDPTTSTTTSPSSTTTTDPPTTTTSPTTTAPPQTTVPSTTQATVPPPTEQQSTDNGEGEAEAGAEDDELAVAALAQGITFTTVANLLIPGDGTEGAQRATTTTTAPAEEGSSADDENRLIWMIIAGLGGVAVLVALLTWRYWLLTRPGLDLDDDFDAGAGTAAAWNAQRRRGQGPADPYRDEPRDPRRSFVGSPSTDYPGAATGPATAPGRPGAPGAPGAPT